MKTLPRSWKKPKETDQLSFTETLFAEERREDIFHDNLLTALRNIKWLKYRSQHAKLTVMEKLTIFENLGLVLDQASILMHKLTRKSKKYRHKELVDFVSDIAIQHVDNGFTDEITRGAFLEHHSRAYSKIVGMFYAYDDILKKHKPITKKLLLHLEISLQATKRLNHAI